MIYKKDMKEEKEVIQEILEDLKDFERRQFTYSDRCLINASYNHIKKLLCLKERPCVVCTHYCKEDVGKYHNEHCDEIFCVFDWEGEKAEADALHGLQKGVNYG